MRSLAPAPFHRRVMTSHTKTITWDFECPVCDWTGEVEVELEPGEARSSTCPGGAGQALAICENCDHVQDILDQWASMQPDIDEDPHPDDVPGGHDYDGENPDEDDEGHIAW